MVTFESLSERKDKIAVVGLGYVGLPLAVHLSRHFEVVGYDTKPERIRELKNGKDKTLDKPLAFMDGNQTSQISPDNIRCGNRNADAEENLAGKQKCEKGPDIGGQIENLGYGRCVDQVHAKEDVKTENEKSSGSRSVESVIKTDHKTEQGDVNI